MFSLVANYTDSDSDSNSETSVSVSVVPPAVGPGSLLPSISISSLSTNQIKKPPLLGQEVDDDCQNLISKSVVQLKPSEGSAFNLHREQNEDEDDVVGQKNERTTIIGTDHIEIEDEDDEFVYNRNQIVQPFSAFQRDEDEAEDGDDDDDDEDSDEDSSFSQSKPKPQQLLSNPFRNFDTGEAVVKGASVFQIPFLEQEVKRSAALERHVKMTETAGSQEMINGKKICWNYRKGKCRFGHNCTFAHDSDIQQLNEKDSSGKMKAITPVLSNSSGGGGGSCSSGSSNSGGGGGGSIPGHPDQILDSSMLSVNKEGNSVSTDYDEGIVASSAHLSTSKSSTSSSSGSSSAMSSGSSSSLNNVSNLDLSPERGDPNTSNSMWKHRGKGKKRPGLSQTINPSKKVMKTYYQNQTQP